MTDNEIADIWAEKASRDPNTRGVDREAALKPYFLSAITTAKQEKALELKEVDVSAGDPTRQKASTLDSFPMAMPMIALPDGLEFRNGGVACDMLNGPCACGAWHHVEDLTYRIREQLTSVPSAPPALNAPGECDVEEWTVEKLASTKTTAPWTVRSKTELIVVVDHFDQAHSIVLKHRESCATLRAEIARLRTALERIARQKPDEGAFIAESALKQKLGEQ